VVREEADEVVFWLELLSKSGLTRGLEHFDGHEREAREIAAIVSAAYRTSRSRYGTWKA
jgi:hypothetical protein